MEKWKLFIELVTSICFLIGTIWAGIKAITLFKYRYDADVRGMYINSCYKIRQIMGEIISQGKASKNHLDNIKNLLQDALVFLHKDVAIFIKDVYNTTLDIIEYEYSLATFYQSEKDENEQQQKWTKAFEKMKELNKRSYIIYRKYILDNKLTLQEFENILNDKHQISN